MKTKFSKFLPTTFALMSTVALTVNGQLPTISSFSQSGVLVCTNLEPGSVATVLEAETATGPWATNTDAVPVTSSGTFQLSGLVSPTGSKYYRVRGVRATRALIPAGEFILGDALYDGLPGERPTNSVSVSAFYMDKYEVTKALWDGVYQWATNHGYSFEHGAAGKAASHPAHTVTWYDAVKWCNARSEQEGRVPAYYTEAALTTVYRGGQSNVDNTWVNWTAGYRLPTEAEWEKAARGGVTLHRFPWSDVDTITHSQANYNSSNADDYDISPTRGYHPTYAVGGTPYTSPAGSFAANGYGLYDMAGNVAEWCWDFYADSYYSSPPGTDPHGPATGTDRVTRGGNWNSKAFSCRVANRFNRGPATSYNVVGFRTVLSSSQ